MKLFSLKSLLFYVGSLAFVIGLFSLTTAYGEANLKPPTKIAGRYRLSAQTWPGCLRTEALILTLQQSGVYVHAALSQPEPSDAAPAKIKPVLEGFWRSQQLTLSGAATSPPACATAKPQTVVQIQGTIAQNQLNGTISLNGAMPTPFTAERLAVTPASEGH
jgi:hypothetical protein